MMPPAHMILAGDIGGTNTRLALVEPTSRQGLRIKRRGKTANADHDGLASVASEFLEQTGAAGKVKAACFGVAGPVGGGKVTLTNLDWTLDEKQLARELRIARVSLINDLVAHAEGTNVLPRRDAAVLNKGMPEPRGNRAIIAAGTGLGEGVLAYDPDIDGHRALASEGGHCDFSPRDPREDALAVFLRNQLGRTAEWESVLSGPGLRNIYDFLLAPGPYHVDGALDHPNPTPAEITQAGVARSSRACVAALEWFVSLYGAEAGNLALKALARGGVFVGGGIAPHIARLLRRPVFRRAFTAHGPAKIRKMLREIPIILILTDENALLGAAHYARRLLEEKP
jgi:glucokinase